MKNRDFSLQPLPGSGRELSVKINGSIARYNHTLAIRYALQDPLAEVVIPAPGPRAARKIGLWEETCFEFFVAPKDSPRYWEFNLSPAGHWNVYGLAAYRQGWHEEMAFAALPFGVEQQGETLRLALEVALDKIIPADQALEVAITAVLKIRDGELTYWALTHRGPQADFHRRDSFILAL